MYFLHSLTIKKTVMKSIISKTVVLAAVAAILVSFTSNFGGEGFQISLNGSVILQQFGKDMDAVKTISLAGAAPADQLNIRYYHCGKTGRNKVLAIKDSKNNLLKEWHFKEVSANNEMNCKVQDLMNLKKTNDPVLKLYYTSSELPEGRQLVAVSFSSGSDHASIKK